ncbi:hypothetical protein KR084_002030 [Drosophila pseudotakahashii]|nr:hypothetical protein KR084_002030 [Drosophila pseudotakahashii]
MPDPLWPDEIDTPLDVPAHEQFQKYRGLESFRTSPWDTKENLPADYARIYQIQNFDRTKRRILNEAKKFEGVLPGFYVTLHVINVPESRWNAFKSAQLTDNIIVYGMLPHEHQMCIMNVVLQRMPSSAAIVASWLIPFTASTPMGISISLNATSGSRAGLQGEP